MAFRLCVSSCDLLACLIDETAKQKRFENINKAWRHRQQNTGKKIKSFAVIFTCFSQTLHWNGFSVLGNFIVLLSALDMRDLRAIFLILPTVAGRELIHGPAFLISRSNKMQFLSTLSYLRGIETLPLPLWATINEHNNHLCNFSISFYLLDLLRFHRISFFLLLFFFVAVSDVDGSLVAGLVTQSWNLRRMSKKKSWNQQEVLNVVEKWYEIDESQFGWTRNFIALSWETFSENLPFLDLQGQLSC